MGRRELNQSQNKNLISRGFRPLEKWQNKYNWDKMLKIKDKIIIQNKKYVKELMQMLLELYYLGEVNSFEGEIYYDLNDLLNKCSVRRDGLVDNKVFDAYVDYISGIDKDYDQKVKESAVSGNKEENFWDKLIEDDLRTRETRSEIRKRRLVLRILLSNYISSSDIKFVFDEAISSVVDPGFGLVEYDWNIDMTVFEEKAIVQEDDSSVDVPYRTRPEEVELLLNEVGIELVLDKPFKVGLGMWIYCADNPKLAFEIVKGFDLFSLSTKQFYAKAGKISALAWSRPATWELITGIPWIYTVGLHFAGGYLITIKDSGKTFTEMVLDGVFAPKGLSCAAEDGMRAYLSQTEEESELKGVLWADYVVNYRNYASSGASSEGRIVFNNKRVRVRKTTVPLTLSVDIITNLRVMGSKISNVISKDEKLRDLLHVPTGVAVWIASVHFKSNEKGGKGRKIVAYPLISQIMMNWLDTFQKGVISDTTLDLDPKSMMEIFSDIIIDCGNINLIKFPADYKSFDTLLSVKDVELSVLDSYRYAPDEYKTEIKQKLEYTILKVSVDDIDIDDLLNALKAESVPYIIFEGYVYFLVTGGLQSGLPKTASAGTKVNIARWKWMKNELGVFMKGISQGDDLSSIFDKYLASLKVACLMMWAGWEINNVKQFVSYYRTEFLRYVIDGVRMRGYFARLLTSMIERDPLSSPVIDILQEVEAIKSIGESAIRRGANIKRVRRWIDLVANNLLTSWNIRDLEALYDIPKYLGGLGLHVPFSYRSVVGKPPVLKNYFIEEFNIPDNNIMSEWFKVVNDVLQLTEDQAKRVKKSWIEDALMGVQSSTYTKKLRREMKHQYLAYHPKIIDIVPKRDLRISSFVATLATNIMLFGNVIVGITKLEPEYTVRSFNLTNHINHPGLEKLRLRYGPIRLSKGDVAAWIDNSVNGMSYNKKWWLWVSQYAPTLYSIIIKIKNKMPFVMVEDLVWGGWPISNPFLSIGAPVDAVLHDIVLDLGFRLILSKSEYLNKEDLVFLFYDIWAELTSQLKEVAVGVVES
jgi:hypothetical protein